jgi:hypothetical protein
MFHFYLNEAQEAKNLFTQFLDPSAIAAIIAALVALYSVYLSSRNFKIQRIESERQEIYKKLNDFYGPMRMLLKTSCEFSLLLKKNKEHLKRDDENGFRVLTYLIRGGKFETSDNALLQKIIYDGKKIEKVILNNAGLIDGDNLHLDLNRLLTHIRLIRMASMGEFETGVNMDRPYDKKVFPRAVNHIIDQKFFELKLRLETLNRNTNETIITDLKQQIALSKSKIEELKN